ncbi:hypothetical protein [Paenibacillus terrae]|uniref:Uncharacterized protein n=1 Tax=Paenibacillus terrae TaxID=159743 RepID=A0A0D7WV03_9BACL|nr:hypothetical protein [Paenibacillus terrae]KJD43021.1 hypothetical protein QD47_24985 [Paenibacillus terrae]
MNQEDSMLTGYPKVLRDTKFIALSLILSLVIGSGAALMHIAIGMLSSLFNIPCVGLIMFAYMTMLSKYKRNGTNHFAFMVIMIAFFFVATILIH